MPKASEHSSRTIQKRLIIGDSGAGKTSSLASLVKAGYKLRIYDFDNLLDPLMNNIKRVCPDKLDNVEFMSFRDKLKATPLGPVVAGTPTAFVDSLKALDKWEDGSRPSEWGSEYVAVIDSHTLQAQAAYLWARGLQGASGIPEGVATRGVDPRNIFFTAQRAVMNCISMLTSPDFNANVLVLAHVKYMEHDGVTKGFPNSIGAAISPEIPSYFSSVTLATKNESGQRVLRTRSTRMIDLKDSRAFDPAFATELPMDTGLATLFQ
jgi:hypothetical protein